MLVQSIVSLTQFLLTILVYGVSGIGKTSLIKTLVSVSKKKILVLDAENGMKGIARDIDPTKIDIISLNQDDKGKFLAEEERFHRFKEFMDFVQKEETKKTYDYIVIDSMSEVSQNIFKHMEAKFDGYKLWGEYTGAMVDMIKFFRDLNSYNIICLCLEERIDVEGEPSYFFPAIGGKKAKDYILPCFDEVYRMVVDAEKNRKLICQPTVKTQAKNRLGGLSEVEDPDLGKIIKRLKGEKNV